MVCTKRTVHKNITFSLKKNGPNKTQTKFVDCFLKTMQHIFICVTFQYWLLHVMCSDDPVGMCSYFIYSQLYRHSTRKHMHAYSISFHTKIDNLTQPHTHMPMNSYSVKSNKIKRYNNNRNACTRKSITPTNKSLYF